MAMEGMNAVMASKILKTRFESAIKIDMCRGRKLAKNLMKQPDKGTLQIITQSKHIFEV